MKRTKKLTLSALFVALSVVILFAASFLEIADLTVSLFASFLLALALIELGDGWAFMIYAGTSLLSLLLLQNKFIAGIYLLFSGLYPLIKRQFDKLRFRLLRLAVKFVYFNAALALVLLAARFLFSLETYAGWLLALFVLVANLTFFLDDLLLGRLTLLYLTRYRARFRKFFK